MNYLVHAFLVGVGATVIMDIYSIIIKSLGVNTLDYRFVGRWIGHLFNGKYWHNPIFNSPPVKHELIMGWVAHYTIGITFSYFLILVFGKKWLLQPSLTPALIIGITTIIAPYLLMQPAFGLGVAASKVPDPFKARILSLLAHSIYGLGLFLSAKLVDTIIR